MKFLADENVSSQVVKFLNGKGYDIEYASKGLKNSSLLVLAKKENRVLLTHDSDFANVLAYPPNKYCGIVVFRIHPPSLEKLKKALEQLLSKTVEQKLSGCLAVLEEEIVVFTR